MKQEQNTSNQDVNSDADRKALLKEFGIAEDSYKFANQKSRRALHMRSIIKIAPDLLAENPGITMFCAETVLRKLHSVGMAKSAAGTPIHSSWAIGDILGKHGLCLPSAIKKRRKCYLLTAIDLSEEEKAAKQEVLDGLSPRELLAMPVA